MDFSKIVSDTSVHSPDISYEDYIELYKSEEDNPANAEFYPRDFEDRKKYITEFWFSTNRLSARARKLTYGWQDIKLNYSEKPHILELGSNFLTSIKVLSENIPNAKFDLLEFSNYMQGNFEVAFDLFKNKIDLCMGACVTAIPTDDDKYDYINASSFFEHLPNEVLQKGLQECYRVIKTGGKLIQYSDHTDAVGGKHLVIIPASEMAKRIEASGFKRITDYVFEK